jgi:elongation factor Ts
MEIKADLVKQLRDMTASGMMEAKQALVEAGGDFDKAVETLKSRGAAIAAKKSERVAANGVVTSYIHAGSKIGVLLEVMVETDFVARDEKFVAFARDVAVHIAGMNPKYVTAEEVPADELAEQSDQKAYLNEVVLLNQSFVKDSSKTVGDLLNEQIAFFKENIKIGRFVRLELGVVPTC